MTCLNYICKRKVVLPMAKKVDVVHLSDEIAKILDNYRDDIADATDAGVEAISKKATKEIKENAKQFGAHYASGWTRKKTNATRGKLEYTVHNRWPGLPHLLENGHVKILWGRATGEYVPGRKHIAPVADHVKDDLVNDIKRRIERA